MNLKRITVNTGSIVCVEESDKMEIIILVLLACLLVCTIVMIVVVKRQANQNEENAIRILMKNQETQTKSENFDQQMKQSFNYVLNQVHELRKDQALSKQSIDSVENNIRTINQVMTNTKARGNWGEYQLDLLLELYAAKNPNVYSMQFTLLNGRIADAVLHMPQTDRILCIDSKFPMENYLNLMDEFNDIYFRAFKTNIKKHVDDIASKYINAQTVDHAIMFIPSEAIYQFICSECEESLNYALTKHVLITSPTTLVGVIYTLVASTKDFYRAKNIKEIEKNIILLQEDVDRLVQRSQKAEKSLDSLVDQFRQVSISATKISNRIEKMADGKEI